MLSCVNRPHVIQDPVLDSVVAMDFASPDNGFMGSMPGSPDNMGWEQQTPAVEAEVGYLATYDKLA